VSTVVGREAELERIEAFLRDDRRTALVILGEPGIGKTTLWEHAVASAGANGATVLFARPAEPEATLAFGGLTDLLAGVPADVVRRLPTPQREGLEAALLRASSKRSPGQRLVATAFLSVVQALARDAPVILAVDDLHWLDKPSSAVLQFAARRIRDEPVRLVLSVREAAQAALGAMQRELPVERVELGPLSVAALHRVLSDSLGRSFSRPVIVRIAEASDGNPLYALEIAREIERRNADVTLGAVPVPSGLEELVRGRVRTLPESSRDALLRAASLARPDTTTVDADALASAEEAGLVRVDADRRIYFTHPLYASAVYSAAPLARRRETHRALAELVADPVERARHLALGSPGGDEAVLAELESAVRAARARGAPDTAAELTELALRLVPAGTDRAQRLQLELAEHLFLASDLWRARALLEVLRQTLADGDLRAQALLLLSDIDYWRTGESAALVLAEQALATAVDPLQQARCQTRIALSAGTVDLPRAASAAAAAVELLERQPRTEPALLAAALGARIRAALFLGEGFDAEAAQRALQLEEDDPPAIVDVRIAFKLGQWLRYVDDFEGARARLEEVEQQANDEGDESSLANILLNRLIVETWAGDWSAAAELADRMIVAFEQHGVVSRDLELWRAYFDAHVGRLGAVRAAAARAARDEPIIAAVWSRSLGLAELAAGEPDAAYADLANAMQMFDSVEFREPAVWRVDGDAIEAALESGAEEQAERWLKRLQERAKRSPIPWTLAVSARCEGLVLAARGELEPATDALERALAEHERCPMPFERARTLLAQGQIMRRLKRKREARDALEEARAIFAQLGADPWIGRADDELARVRTRRAPDELSATERKIAELAADGLSNADIASRMFVSRKTVEANLGRVYRKLGIASRAQLHAALNR
jgi:DNA-binding CsgD family transcriptional regulator